VVWSLPTQIKEAILTTTSQEIAQLLETVEALAVKDAYDALASYRPEMGASVEDIDGAVCCVLKTVPSTLFNRVLEFGLGAPASEASLDRISELYERNELPFVIQLSPLAEPGPDTLKRWLDERGFVVASNWAKSYRNVEPPTEIQTDLRIVRIGPDDQELYGSVMAQGFGAPDFLRPWFAAPVGRAGWTHYLAFDDETAVAGATMFVPENSDGAELFGAATLEAYRGRGAQGALIIRRIVDAAELGCRWAVTETQEEIGGERNPSFQNMLRMGFQTAYMRPNYRSSQH
jgi:GNAT superfamily N-acetyltransferase